MTAVPSRLSISGAARQRPATASGPRRSSRRAAPRLTIALLVRHGQTPTTGRVLPGRASGLHLGEAGKAQAQGAADRIAALTRSPTAVYASPLERAKETAAPIARTLGLRVRTESGLAECDVGRWQGRSLRTLMRTKEWPTVQRWPTGFRFPGGESFAEISVRTTDTVVALADRHPGETFVCVSHADPIKALLAAVAGVPLDLFQRIVISPCSISAIGFTGAGPMILCMNSTASLTELVPS
jgi:probable phosphomutase (TIGR03848 family)